MSNIKTSVYISQSIKKKYDAVSILMKNKGSKAELTDKIFEIGLNQIVEENNLGKELKKLLEVLK